MIGMQKKYMEKEWKQLRRAEQKFLDRNMPIKTPGWQEKAARIMPAKLNDTLNGAFFKAFELIFEKGTGIIEKTYQKEKKEQNYKIHEYAAEVRKNRSSLRAFGREANAGKTINMAVSTVEGVGMGFLGMGIPDIPLFLGVLLKSIYEVALSYGFSYDTPEEQIFILKLIETALSHDSKLAENNMELDLWIRENTSAKSDSPQEDANDSGAEKQQESSDSDDFRQGEAFAVHEFHITRSEQIRRTSDALSEELLYLKFVQGIPVIGVLGGLSDMVYQKKISDYAVMKYKRRFLEKRGVQDDF